MTILADTVDLVIGVDPHKHTHTDAVVAVATGRHRGTVTACAAPQGFAELLEFAAGHDGRRCWVIESCGSWGRGLATWLQTSGEDVREIDSPSRPAPPMGKKTDDLDAPRVAREALRRDDLATPRDTGHRDVLAAPFGRTALVGRDDRRHRAPSRVTCQHLPGSPRCEASRPLHSTDRRRLHPLVPYRRCVDGRSR